MYKPCYVMQCRKLLIFLLLCFVQPFLFSGTSLADSGTTSDGFETNPFYDQRVKLDAPPIDTISEHIDPFSGNMQIVQTDLELPGNGGLNLKLIRSYNSLLYSRRDDTLNPYFHVEAKQKSPLGYGWSMHMGILRYPQAPGTLWGGSPILELPDGTKQIFFKDKNDASRLISKDFWTLKTVKLYDYYAHGDYEVKSPEGIIYSFNNYAQAGYKTTDNKEIAQVIKIQNPAGTAVINITYDKEHGVTSYLKTITDSVGRTITFNYDYTASRLTSITTDTRTLLYKYTSINGINLLSSVTLPLKSSQNNGTVDWQYNYDSTRELTEIKYPTGGINTYTYSDKSFYNGDSCSMLYRVVTQKTTSGRGINNGTWTYAYNSGAPNTTVITGPNVTETHTFYGWAGGAGGKISSENVWKVGLPISKEYNFSGTSFVESYGWTKGTAVSSTVLRNVDWGCPGFLVQDNAIYAPFLSSKTITRDGKTYTTTNGDFNIYGDPQSVTESGDLTRSKSLTYWTNASKNIVKGKPASESVSGGFSGSSSSSWSYDSNSGNPTQITKDGVTTNLGYDSNGNLSSVTDANSKQTTFQWSNGRVSKATNPIYSVSRSINTNGTITSETNGRGYTTNYSYDANLRLTGVTPPVGNATSFTYPADSSYRKEARGSYWIQHNFDGFARSSGSSDSKGVTTTIAYNAYGVKDYTDTNIGDKTLFDYFGRVKQSIHKDNTSISYAYSGSNVTITDENNKAETFTYNAFENPDEKYLMAVKDRESNTTSYSRNIHGNVTGITQGNVTRSYTFDTKNFLTAESTPEGGSITYGRDNIGTLTSKTDATGTKSFSYDNLYRLTGITSGSSSITYGYDNANNRTLMTSPSATAGYSYDAANRMTKKTETISGKAYTTGYGYDGNDNITAMTYPFGRTVGYGYNGNNQVTSINGFGGSVTSVAYNTAGLPTSFTYSNGKVNTLTYTNRNLPHTIKAASAVDLQYGYDSRGNTTSITNNLSSSKNQSFGYDSLSRITNFNGAWGSGSFGYDSLDNRTSKTVAGSSTSYSYSSNRLVSTTGGESASYSYNGIGALTGGSWQGGNYSLAYDPFDNLQTYSQGATALANFGYDGDGMRIVKTANGKTVVYHYDQGGRVLSEDNGAGRLLADYVFLNGKLVAKVEPIATISVAPASDSFGNTYVNTASSFHNYTISNPGFVDLAIGTISITSATEFVKNTDGCSGQTLSPSATCTFQVAFAPVSAGAKTTTIVIPSNDPAIPNYSVSINGIGVLPLLTVSKTGTGTGVVSGTGISCGATCSASYTTATTVALAAVADTGSSFAGWSGACSGTGSCAITMNTDTAVTAAFSTLPPVASLSITPATGSSPVNMTFTDQSQGATSRLWDFGDGTTSTAQNPTHIYMAPGTYTVSLTVSNAGGSNTATQTVTINACATDSLVKIGSSYFSTLQAAYDAAADGETIQAVAIDFTENLTANAAKNVTLDGGYLCGFASNPDKTNVIGAPHISNGTMIMKNIQIK